MAHLRVLGCLCFVKELNQVRKLDDRSRPGIFIGYADGAKAYRVYELMSRRVLMSHDVVFDETRGCDWSKSANHAASMAEELVFDELIDAGGPGAQDASATAASPLPRSPSPGEIGSAASTGGEPYSASAPSPVSVPSPALASPSPSPASATPREAAQTQIESTTPLQDDEDRLDAFYDGEPLRYRRIDNILGDEAVPDVEPRVCAELHLTHAGEWSTYAEAQGNPAWCEAMQLELESVEKNRTWELVDPPAGHRPITLKWVFKFKKDEKSAVIKHKARLVARGFVQ